MTRRKRGRPAPAPPVPTVRRTGFLIGLALAALTLAAFARVAGNDFVNYDDGTFIVDNPQVRAGWSWEGLRWAWTTNRASSWHPLTWMSFQSDAQLFGLWPVGYHLHNLLLHAVNAVLLFGLLRRMTGAVWRSAAVAAFFALHPLRVESVAWATERKDVLSTFFLLLALWAYLAYTRRPAWGRYLAVLAAFALGLLAKPMLVTFPFVLLLLDYWPLGRLLPAARPGEESPAPPARAAVPWWRLLGEKLPLFALAAASAGVTLWAMRTGKAVRTLEEYPLDLRLANALIGYAGYVGMTFWPAGLSVYYPPDRGGLFSARVLFSVVLLLGISLLVSLAARRGRRYAAVGWLWYLGTLVPVSGLVQVGGHVMADRYTYVPHVGLLILLVWGITDLTARLEHPAPVRVAATAALLAACLFCTWDQVGHWHDSLALWGQAVAADNGNDMAHLNLGVLLADAGREDEAVGQFTAALRVNPDSAAAHHDLALALLRRGMPAEAEPHAEAAVRLRPEDAGAQTNLGMLRSQQGRLDEAAACYSRALELDPGQARACQNLGVVLARQGKVDRALDCFSAAARLEPENAEAHANRGMALLRLGRWREAVSSLRRAVELRPGAASYHVNLAYALGEDGQTEAARLEYQAALRLRPDLPQALGRSAWMLATHPDDRVRDGASAVLLARQACQAGDRRDPRLLDVLAAAYAEAGRFDEAAATAHQALALATTAKQQGLAGAIAGRLRLYENRRAFRDEGGAAYPGGPGPEAGAVPPG